MNTCIKNDKKCDEKTITDVKTVEEAKSTEQKKDNVLDESSLDAVVGGHAPDRSFESGFRRPSFN